MSVYVFNGATRIRYNNVLSTSGGTGMAARNLGFVFFVYMKKNCEKAIIFAIFYDFSKQTAKL